MGCRLSRLPWWIPIALPGCLWFADEPTSIKRLEPAPGVEIVSPAEDSLLNGVVEVRIASGSTLGFQTLLRVDGATVHVIDGGPLTFAWDTRAEARGDHTLEAEVIDEIGRRATAEIDVEVDQLPEVAFTEPEPGAALAGRVSVRGDASDDDKVARVSLLIDGDAVATDAGDPYQFQVDTCDFPSGDHTLTLYAEDDVPQAGTADLDVTFAQTVQVALTHVGATTRPDDTLTAQVAWDVGVDEVRFALASGATIATVHEDDGTECTGLGCPGRCLRFEVPWDTSALAAGRVDVEAVVVDASGATATDTLRLTVDYDLDGDGYDSVGYGGDDCDDDLAATRPGAAEPCDAQDNDCDGAVDELFDADGDGYAGAPECPAAARVDCDDARTDVHPDAAEVCDDGLDSDCGGPDAACAPSGTGVISNWAPGVVLGETPGDLLGLTLANAGDVDGDGVGDVVIGSYVVDATIDVQAGASGGVYLITDTPTTAVSAGTAAAAIEGTLTDGAFGRAVVALGDPNGDGYDDVAITESGSSLTRVFRGPLSGDLTPTTTYYYYDSSSSSSNGTSAAAGDLDRDGDVDLLIGRPGQFLFFEGPLTATKDTSADLKITDRTSATVGYAVAIVQDVDGDGRDDVLIGAPYDDTLATDAGAAYLITDFPTASVDLDDAAEAFLRGGGAGGLAGLYVASGGDADDDGYGDLLVGAPSYNTDDGRAYLVTGPVTGTKSLSTQHAIFSEGVDSYVGVGLAGGFDLNGDGVDDLAVGASGDDAGGVLAGMLAVYYGPVAGGAHKLSTTADLVLLGDSAYDELGATALGVPDIDGDGTDELLVSAIASGTGNPGAVYFLLGTGW